MGNKSNYNKNFKNKKENKERTLRVTTLNELKKYEEEGSIVELPSFDERNRFVVKLKRPSLLGLIAQGVIPNHLQGVAMGLFNGDMTEEEKEDGEGLYNVLLIFAKECLVEPTFEELQEIGVELTDEQLLTIFQFSQQGVRALEKFRDEQFLSKAIEELQNFKPDTLTSSTN